MSKSNSYKISDTEKNAVKVGSSADVLSGSATENKAVFDALPELIVDRHNKLCGAVAEVEDKTTFAGATIFPEGAVYAKITAGAPEIENTSWAEIGGAQFYVKVNGTEYPLHLYVSVSNS